MDFNRNKVKKIAIDVDKKQQLFLSSSKYNIYILRLLKGMGYKVDYKKLLIHSNHYIFIINTIDRKIFRSQGNVLAQALPQGAKLLDFINLMKLIDF